MVTSFCVFCGDTSDLENHHVLPRVLGGADTTTNYITACASCHDKIHLIGKCSNHKDLQRAGIEKAIKLGKYKGRARTITEQQIAEINTRVSCNESKTHIAISMGISRDTLYRYLKIKEASCAS